MKEQKVSYETAILAKEKGFDELCRDYYDEDKKVDDLPYFAGDGSGWDKNSTCQENDHYSYEIVCMAPSQSLLQRWLREVHNIHVIPYIHVSDTYRCKIVSTRTGYHGLGDYESVLEEGLTIGLKIIP